MCFLHLAKEVFSSLEMAESIKFIFNKSMDKVCQLCFNTFNDLKSHVKEKHSENGRVCSVCYQVFSKETNCKIHVFERHDRKNKVFQCKLCSSEFLENRARDLKSHLAKLHSIQSSGSKFQRISVKPFILMLRCDRCYWSNSCEALMKKHTKCLDKVNITIG